MGQSGTARERSYENGDYAFPVRDAVLSRKRSDGSVTQVNSMRPYAADGNARVRGVAMLATTYGSANCRRSTES